MSTNIEAGNAVVLYARIKDNTKDLPVLVDPTTITISLKKPDGTFAVQDAAMTKISVGRYRYIHQTLTNDPLGEYIQIVKTVYQGKNNQETVSAFVLTAT